MAMLLRSVRRAPWRREACAPLSIVRAGLSAASFSSEHSPEASPAVDGAAFRELVAEPSTPDEIMARLLDYFEVPSEWHGVPDERPVRERLNFKSAQAPAVVTRLTPLVRWGFQQLGTDAEAAEVAPEQVGALFDALQPWANMVRDTVWRYYYLRQFFLSDAPLSAYLAVFERHLDAIPSPPASDDADGSTSQVARRNPLQAMVIVKEYIWRGRFPEALAAYAELPLSSTDRQQIVALLSELEQYETLLELYKVHHSVSPRLSNLDRYEQLHALVKLGRRDEMMRTFQRLSAHVQSRADMQSLLK